MIGDNDTVISITFYIGAYGPTIRVDTRSMESLVMLKDIFLALSEARMNEVKLHEMSGVSATGMKALTLKLVNGKEDRKTLRQVRASSESPVFHWLRSSEGWQLCADLLDGIIQHPGPGHQYFTEEGIDDALLLIAFLEAHS